MNRSLQRGVAVLFALLVITAAATLWIVDPPDVRNTTDGQEWVDSDSDGLSDIFEKTVTGTDPNDPDSDSTETESDEGDNDVTDGKERFGDSPLPSYIQQRISADPFSNDTDGDGVTDMFELVDLGLVHNAVDSADTDGDGVSDADEDPDNDTLTNRREQDLGTDPLVADTDGDGLTDGYEVEHDLDPLVADDDNDELDDGSEVNVGADPAQSDTDGDGILDGNETTTVTTANETLDVSLTITGEGDPTNTTSIAANESIRFDNISSTVSPVVKLETNSSFSRAEVTIGYNDSRVSAANESNLAVYTYNESRGTFIKLNSTVNTTNNTVTATTTHFSTFAVFNTRDWNATFDTPLPIRGSGIGDTEVIPPIYAQLVVDASASMKDNDPNGYRMTAAKRFVDNLVPFNPANFQLSDRASVVLFGKYAVSSPGFTTNFASVKSVLDPQSTIGGTDLSGGLEKGIDEFKTANPSSPKVIILLTDGRSDTDEQSKSADRGDLIEQAERAKAHNITVYTIGFGDDNERLLRGVAEITGGEYYPADEASKLPGIFKRVADTTTIGKDSDGDGIPDAVETTGIRSGEGKIYYTKWDDEDSDNDGIPDGVEAGHRIQDHHYTVISNPTDLNGDRDLDPDFNEYEAGTDPLDKNTDDDQYDDHLDREPLVPNTDEADSRQARAIIAGAIFGETGMKGGLANRFVGALASSPFYLIGWLGFSFVPIAGALADIRDAVQAFIKGDPLNGVFSVAGIVPGAGDAAKMVKTIEKYVETYGKSGIVARMVARTFLSNSKVPSSVKVKTLNALTKGKASKLNNQGIPADDIVTYVRKNIYLKQIYVLKKGEIPADDIKKYVDEGYDLGRMNEALKQYKNYKSGGGRPLSQIKREKDAKGALGEILSLKSIKKEYDPSKHKFINDVKSYENGEDIGQFDWVVVDNQDNIVAVYEAKSGKRARTAKQKLTNRSIALNNKSRSVTLRNAQGLTIDQFRRNHQNINYRIIGPSDGRGYDTTFDLRSDELEDLAKSIHSNKL